MKNNRVLFASLIGLFIFFSQFTRILAWVSGEEFLGNNSSKYGAQILLYRNKFLKGDLPTGYDLVFVGSSRTMAFFNPPQMEELLQKKCGKGQAYNLGNIGGHLPDLKPFVDKFGQYKTVVIEFSPLMLTVMDREKKREIAPMQKSYLNYRRHLEVFETWASGWIKGISHFENGITLRNFPIGRLISDLKNHRLSLKNIYYTFRKGYGQEREDSGLVKYRTFLTGREAGKIAEQILGPDPEKYVDRLKGKEPIQLENWESMITEFRRTGAQVIVIRPMIAPWLYDLENRHQGPSIGSLEIFLQNQKIPYVDLNKKHDFQFSDGSHIDWYDVEPANAAVLPEIIAQVDCQAYL